jgi:HD-GYP domain-containing protein (c-di-GMP phosphodiesterase class II)
MSDSAPPNIPNPDPSLATNERLEDAKAQLRREIASAREESRGWTESLQILMEEKIKGAENATTNLDRVVQTRLAGSETALNAAMAAADKVTQKQADNFEAVLTEAKIGLATQIKGLNEKIDGLKERMSESSGHSSGVSHTASMITAGLAALAATASVVIVLVTK